VHMHSHDGFNRLTANRRSDVFQTHSSEQLHHLLDLFAFLLHGAFLIFGGSFQTLSQFLGPHGLHTQKGHLGRVILDEVAELRHGHVDHLLAGRPDNILNGVLHFFLQLTQPVFNGAFTFLVISELDGFFIPSHHLCDCFYDLLIGTFLLGILVESHLIDSVEELFEVFLNGSGLTAL